LSYGRLSADGELARPQDCTRIAERAGGVRIDGPAAAQRVPM